MERFPLLPTGLVPLGSGVATSRPVLVECSSAGTKPAGTGREMRKPFFTRPLANERSPLPTARLDYRQRSGQAALFLELHADVVNSQSRSRSHSIAGQLIHSALAPLMLSPGRALAKDDAESQTTIELKKKRTASCLFHRATTRVKQTVALMQETKHTAAIVKPMLS